MVTSPPPRRRRTWSRPRHDCRTPSPERMPRPRAALLHTDVVLEDMALRCPGARADRDHGVSRPGSRPRPVRSIEHAAPRRGRQQRRWVRMDRGCGGGRPGRHHRARTRRRWPRHQDHVRVAARASSHPTAERPFAPPPSPRRRLSGARSAEPGSRTSTVGALPFCRLRPTAMERAVLDLDSR